MPLAVSGGMRCRGELGRRSSGEVREVTSLQLVVDRIFDDILQVGRPPRHLVLLLTEAVLSGRFVVGFTPSLLKREIPEEGS